MSRTPASTFLRSILAIALLAAVIYWSNPRSILSALSNLSLWSVVLIILVAVLLLWLSVLKWRLFLEHFALNAQRNIDPSTLSTWKLTKSYLVGYFVNAFLPSQMGGDVARSVSLGRNIGQHEAAVSTLLERYTGLIAMLSLALVVMWFTTAAEWPLKVCIGLFSLGAIILTLIALSPKFIFMLGRVGIGDKVIRSLSKIQDGLSAARKNPFLMAKAFAWSYAFHLAAIFNVYVIAHAIGWQSASLTDLATVVPLILILGNIPITPSNLGIQEGAYLFFLSSIGANSADALAIALLLRAKGYILAMMGCLVWISSRPALSSVQRHHETLGQNNVGQKGGVEKNIVEKWVQ